MSDQNPLPTVNTGAVDTHCHLFLLEDEPSAAVEAAKAAGVDRLVCVGIDAPTSARSLELAESMSGVFATAGLHPHEATDLDASVGGVLEELIGHPLVVGVGETGLDYLKEYSPREAQERALRLHIAWSNDVGKPLVVHVRDAWPDVLRVLDEGRAERVVIHCFSGDPSIARECEARGYWLSFAGNITYPKNVHLRDAAAAVALDRVLTETDSPFLAPQDRRGKPNVPGAALTVVGEIARVRDVGADEVRLATAANARAAFPGLR